ncbi:MAG: hypothetical protein C5B55_03350 [Blastocatellia bacterium]|nr:MAG: hypothetical protein C5B55_03350 [Blastocatellia bacterium]
MAQRIVNRIVPGSALSLGIMRSVMHGAFLITILVTSFSDLGQLPTTILRPVGAMKLLPWSFYDQLLNPATMTVLKWVMILSLLLSTAGYLTSLTTKVSFLFVVFYEGLVRSFGHFNHDEMIGVYFLCVLAFSPCGDSFSLDRWSERKSPKSSSFVYSYPILLMQLLLAWAYFSSALVKLRVAGLKYFAVDNLPTLAIYHSLDNLHDTNFRLAFLLPQVRWLLPYIVGVVLLWELLFPLTVLFRRIRWWILGFGVVFHLTTLPVMNVFFPYFLISYLVFVNWDRVAAKLRQSVQPVETRDR